MSQITKNNKKQKNKKTKNKNNKKNKVKGNRKNKSLKIINGGSAVSNEINYDPGIKIDFSQIVWPGSCGCLNNFHSTEIQIGQKFSRFGKNFGGFLGDDMVPYSNRSIPYIKTIEDYNKIKNDDLKGLIGKNNSWKYHRFEALRPYTMYTCSAAPMNSNKSGQNKKAGGATQYFMFNDKTIEDLSNSKVNENQYRIKNNDKIKCDSSSLISIKELIDREIIKEIEIDEKTYPEYE